MDDVLRVWNSHREFFNTLGHLWHGA